VPRVSADPAAKSPVKPAAPAASTAPFDPMQFLGLTNLEEADEYTRAMFFGDAGTGKTSAMAFAANLPGDGLTVIIDAEGGLKKSALKELGVDTTKIVMWPDRSKGEEITYESLENLLYQLRQTIRERPGAIKVVGFDSTTEVVGKLLTDITRYAYEKDQNLSEAQKAKRIADGKKLRESPLETQIQDYGVLTNQMRTLFRGFRDLGCHLVLTALEKDDAEGENGTKATGPELPNKVSTSLRGYVDLVIRFTSETLQTSALTQETLIKAETKKSLTRQCKDRDNKLPLELLTPTLDRILAYLSGDLTLATDPEITRHQEIRDKADKYRASRSTKRN
jgi:hypothetical protein